jgi:hypothetical protein
MNHPHIDQLRDQLNVFLMAISLDQEAVRLRSLGAEVDNSCERSFDPFSCGISVSSELVTLRLVVLAGCTVNVLRANAGTATMCGWALPRYVDRTAKNS